MGVMVFRVRPPSEQERKQAAYKLQHVIRPRGRGEAVYVGRGIPQEGASVGLKPRFTLYEDLAGQKPLCVVARPVARQADKRLVVLDPGGGELAALRAPARQGRWRPRHEIELPDGRALRGRGGTVTSWVCFAVLSPLWLVFNVVWAVGGIGDSGWSVPVRTAWRPARGSGLGLSPLKYYGLTERYKARTNLLDARVAYAQSVLHRTSA
jgi:hypothetical protein